MPCTTEEVTVSTNTDLKFRRVERQVNGAFCPCLFEELVSGDRFRLFDDCEDPVETGTAVYLATGDALQYGVEGNFTIQAHVVDEVAI